MTVPSGLHLTVVSYERRINSDFEAVILNGDASSQHLFARCQVRESLFDVVRRSTATAKEISVLDVYGHGFPGGLWIGDEILVDDERRTGWGELKSIVDLLLREGGCVRLLGCNAGVGKPGRDLVSKLSKWIGCLVLASTAYLDHFDFGPTGLSPTIDQYLLRSDQLPKDPVPPSEREWKISSRDKVRIQKWVSLLSGACNLAHYRPIGRRSGFAAREDFRVRSANSVIAFAGGRRYAAIYDSPGRNPFVFEWSRKEEPPLIDFREAGLSLHT